MPAVTLTVSMLNKYVKSVLEGDKNLQSVYLKGQISNFSCSSGHYYFTLKDKDAQVSAVMFRYSNSKLKFMPENDMNVIVRCRVSLYEVRGTYQVYVDDMHPDGTGDLAIAFEQLKKKLEAEGLFSTEHKKPIPAFPSRIGVVTSETGAAVRDIINVISRRYPVAEIILCGVAVQGAAAAPQISEAIDLFNEKKAADVLIVGRGGGSIEDLWPFNEETVARAVFRSVIPVISAVGHETDFTICDFVSDLRAPTPSAAAELAVPDMNELNLRFSAYRRNMLTIINSKLDSEMSRLNADINILRKSRPDIYIDDLTARLSDTLINMQKASDRFLSDRQHGLSLLSAKLDALSPLKILSKGYSVVYKDGKSVTDSSVLNKGDRISVRFSKGEKDCEVL